MPKSNKRTYTYNYFQRKPQEKNKTLPLIKETKQTMPNQDNAQSEPKQGKPHAFEKYGTLTDWISAITTIIVAVFTLLLFNKTRNAADAAVDSATAARDTYREQRYNDSIMRYRDSIKAIGDSIDTRNRFKLDSATFNAQIKEFEIEHRPFLQAYNFKTIKPEVGKMINISFKIKNLTPTPIKVIEKKNYIQGSIGSPSMITVINRGNSDTVQVNEYITNETPLESKYAVGVMDEININKASNPNGFWFYVSEIKYSNIVNDSIMYYTFFIKVKYVNENRTYTEFIENENSKHRLF